MKAWPESFILTVSILSKPYCGILVLGGFCADRVRRGPYCNDIGPTFPGTALALGW